MPPIPLKQTTAAEAGDTALYRQPPYNVDAEQALLGALLINNEALGYIGDSLRPEHFYEPVHARIFETIMKFADRGLIANPVTLKHHFDRDEALADIGGGQYLATLAGAAVTVINVADYSQMIYDLALKRELITIGEEMVNTAYDGADATANMQIEAVEHRLFGLASEGASDRGFRPLKHSLTAAIQRAEHAYQNSGQIVGVTSGLKDLDRMLGGMQKSDLLILAGRPSMGKTALATNIAYNACLHFARDAAPSDLADHSIPAVGFFSLEMSAEQLATRILSGAASINSSKLLRGELTNDEFPRLVKESSRLSSMPFYIDDTPALSISALRTRARRLKRMFNLGFLVVDYLQLVRSASAKGRESRVLEISEITQGLKAIAKELNIPVMALSQLSRAVEQREDKKPQLSDLRESGSIEQDADVVMFVYREEYYLSRTQPREGTAEYAQWQENMDKVHGLAEIIIGKQRNGPIGNVTLQFQSDLTRFTDHIRPDHLPERTY